MRQVHFAYPRFRTYIISRFSFALVCCLCVASQAAEEKTWAPISAGVLAKVKPGYPGKTAGVAVDPATGDVFMVIPDQGIWKSSDHGDNFTRVDGGAIGGRCETGFSLNVDPAGKRMMCFMVYGSSASTDDSGKTWTASKSSHFDFGAVDWHDTGKCYLAIRHEAGGMLTLSTDAGQTWKDLQKGFTHVGIFSDKVLLASKGKGIIRSDDGGATWSSVSDATPLASVMRTRDAVGYWLADTGLLVSRDQGKTWDQLPAPKSATVGPFWGKTAEHMIVVAKDGIHETTDGAKSWSRIVPLPEGFSVGGVGPNYAWDPIGDYFYASSMGKDTFRYQRIPDDSNKLGSINYTGDGSDLQETIDRANPGSTIACDPKRKLEISTTITIKQPITLEGVNAALPRGLGKTSLFVVESEGVTIQDSEFHGNYDSVPQSDRAPLLWFQAGKFKIARCTFYDGSKDGVNITPVEGDKGRDIVGGEIRDLKAFRMGRDVVSISGGNNGLRVRDVTVNNVRLERGYHRGAVEVSDGSDNVTVQNVYAQDAVYAIDVQDHGKPSAPNTNIVIENVEAVRCKHIIRTANGPRGHEHLTLRNFTGRECTLPVLISNTKHVRIEKLTILNHTDAKSPPIRLQTCEHVLLTGITIQSQSFHADPIKLVNCSDVKIDGLTKRDPSVGR
jgi:photosystem II stability/assembly factor-like uncharacterized protein